MVCVSAHTAGKGLTASLRCYLYTDFYFTASFMYWTGSKALDKTERKENHRKENSEILGGGRGGWKEVCRYEHIHTNTQNQYKLIYISKP